MEHVRQTAQFSLCFWTLAAREITRYDTTHAASAIYLSVFFTHWRSTISVAANFTCGIVCTVTWREWGGDVCWGECPPLWFFLELTETLKRVWEGTLLSKSRKLWGTLGRGE